MSQPWWRGATLYQIYPRSFADANGDGLGDLAGIAARLPYVASLGVDGVWISPFYPSPMRDFGYDVSEHCDVDARFGTLADFDALLRQAHALGLKVVIDQVWSHTALEHRWFLASRESRDNPHADWYVWADARADGGPPTNWLSWMGGPTWSWEPRRQQYYLHNFLPQMPDLNLHHPEVQQAILGIARFWLDRGVDGFRLDTANYYCHDLQPRDNPPQPPGHRGDVPAAMQQHLHNICQPQTLPFLEQVRALFERYHERMTVAEIGSADNLARMIEYTAGEHRLHTAYSFVMLGDAPDAATLAGWLQPWNEGEGLAAWPSWAMSNHDAPRVATRWAQGDARRIRQCLVLLASLRGTLFLYQGEELGLEQSSLRLDQLQDPFGIAHWPRREGRDGCRTPMPWVAEAPQAGFTTGMPWLPVDERHRALAVDRQAADPHSTLALTRRLLALRRASPALRHGALQILHAQGPLFAMRRSHGDEHLVVALNLGEAPQRFDLPTPGRPERAWLAINGASVQGSALTLPAWSAAIVGLARAPLTDDAPQGRSA